MKFALTLFFGLLVITSCAQKKDNKIVVGKIDTVNSKILKEKRQIWVYVPDDGGNSLYAKQKYPVLYLLDGDGHFYSVMGLIHQLSQVNGNTVLPPMMIVGIPNTDRTRDLTPTHTKGGAYVDSNFVRTSGGGENFAAFLEKELIPYIDKNYSTAPYRILVGHSFGGLTAMNILVHHTNMFNSYVAIDPSMWWDNQLLLRQTDTALRTKNFKGKSLFLAIANTMSEGMDTVKVRNDTSANSIHIRSILTLSDYLKANQSNGLNWSYKYYNDDNHGSVPLISEYDALHFIFNGMQFKSIGKLFDPAFSTDSSVLLVKSHYQNLSGIMGYEVIPPEQIINQLAYGLLESGMPEKAYAFFKMNIDNYPSSFNVYDSMGDYYEMKADKSKAVEYYTKALTIKEWPDTRKKLTKIKSKA
jgi:predicted alpha/beta superfamily hydrolase